GFPAHESKFESSPAAVVSLFTRSVSPSAHLAFNSTSATFGLQLYEKFPSFLPRVFAGSSRACADRTSGRGQIGFRADRHLGRPAAGGGPLHASPAQRRDFAEDAYGLSRDAGFQPSLLHPEGH